MNKFFKTLSITASMVLFITACGVLDQPEERVPQAATYQTVLGKPLSDKAVTDFIAVNNCSPAAEFQLCKDAGVAFWTDANQIVKMVYLYSAYAEGFRRYRGALPFGLTFYDPMWRVEEKLMDPESDDPLQQLGLPEEGSAPDHFHYQAAYKRFGMTVIYNVPFADQDAYIYAIVVDS